jgi:hypothetical protein
MIKRSVCMFVLLLHLIMVAYLPDLRVSTNFTARRVTELNHVYHNSAATVPPLDYASLNHAIYTSYSSQ